MPPGPKKFTCGSKRCIITEHFPTIFDAVLKYVERFKAARRRTVKAFFLVAALPFFVLLVGCVPVDSLNPIYTDNNVIFDPSLVGTWVADNPNDGGLRIARAGENAYQFVVTERADGSWLKESVFDVHLVSLGGEKFLDVQPRQLGFVDQARINAVLSKSGLRFEPSLIDLGGDLFIEFLGTGSKKANGYEVQMRLRPAHWILKVDLANGFLRLAYLDDEWIRNEAKRGTLRARHQKAKAELSDKWVLTSPTVEMQQFVVEQADREGAFSGAMVLRKQKEPVQDAR